jgi:alcohol dehydrogenase (NADP+)
MDKGAEKESMIQVCGYAAQHAKSPLTPYYFERREPRDHDVVIDIQYCGICHSDIHQVNNGWGASTYPMVPGHEIVGIVFQVGTKVTGYKVGDRVGVGNFVGSCGKCDPCHKGLEQYCVEGATWTYNAVEREDGKKATPTQGGYSNKIVVNERYVFRIPDNLPLDWTLFASNALESQCRKESCHHRSWRPGPYRSKNRSCTRCRSHSAQPLA